MYVLYSLDFAATGFWAHCRKHAGEGKTPLSKTVDTNCLSKRAAFIFIHFLFLYQSQSVKQKIFLNFFFFGSRSVEKKLFSFCLSRSGLFVLEWSTPIFVKTFCSLFAFWHSLVYEAKKIVWAHDSRFWSILCKHIGSTTQTLLSPFFYLCYAVSPFQMLCYVIHSFLYSFFSVHVL